jgi:hypothetical protein
MSNVQEFGAKGDGQTDDTRAIQHAVHDGDGHVVLPRGDYRLTKTIEVPLSRTGRFALSGSGGPARLIMTAPGPAIRLVGSHDQTADPAGFQPVVWDRERLPTVSGIEILGAHAEADGIELQRTMQATIHGVLLRRCRYGVHLVQRNRNFLLSHSHIYHGLAVGVFFDGVNLHQTNLIGNHISYCPHAGIKIERSEIRNLQITGNDIEYNFDPEHADSADVWIDVREGTVREGTICSNTIQAKHSPGGANVRIEGAPRESSNTAGLWSITGNVLMSQAVNLLLRSCRGVVVTGNTFASGYERSIVIDKCRHMVVGSNTFDHNPDYTGDRVDGITIRNSAGCALSHLILESTRAGTAEQGGAIEVFQSREITIQGCQVLDPSHRGIYLSEVRDSRISDCTVLDRRTPPVMHDAIRVAGGGGNMFVSNRLAPGLHGDLVAPAAAATVAGNLIAPPT